MDKINVFDIVFALFIYDLIKLVAEMIIAVVK